MKKITFITESTDDNYYNDKTLDNDNWAKT